jgi:hypothetical protein
LRGTAASGFIGVPPEHTLAIARQLRIINHESGLLTDWPVNDEQVQLFHDLWKYRQLYVLKVRQIGASTAVCLDNVLWVSANDSNHQRVRCGIVVDTDTKAQERVRVCYDFALQLGLEVRYQRGTNTLTFPNGSEIIGMTAGGRRAGASMTFHRFHFTELPFWRDPNASYTSLMQALVLGGRVIIETTMGVDDPLAKELWQKDNDFAKRFFSFEDHREYRMPYDRQVLDDELKHELEEAGFTDIESMTYWAWLLKNRCGGDVIRCFREYPQLPEHSWMYAAGRWIRKTPAVQDPVDRHYVEDATERLYLDIYRHCHEGSGYYVIGVDTAAGLGRDRSAVVVVDQLSREIMASFVDSECKMDDLAGVCKTAQELYTYSEKNEFGKYDNRVPICVVEKNGLGVGTVQQCVNLGVRISELQTTKSSRYDGLLYVKRYVEAGEVHGPEELAYECDNLFVSDGDFEGPKDLCMALGFCYTWMANANDPRKKAGPVPGRVDMMAQLERYWRHKRRMGGYHRGG